MSEPLDLLVVDDEPNQRKMLRDYLVEQGHRVREAGEAEEALRSLESGPTDLVLTDVRLPGADGVELVRRARKNGSDAAFLVMTAYGTVENAIEAMRAGAYDYLTKPIRLDDLDEALRRVRRKDADAPHKSDANTPTAQNAPGKAAIETSGVAEPEDPFEDLGPAMIKLRDLVDRVAKTDATVLIRGESGVGKEKIADRLHAKSHRARGPYLKINCAALPDPLLEAELFGHEKGAYTGADREREGLFAAANGGTLLLDEIGDMSKSLQVKLLRVLQEREVRPLGAREATPIDVRVVCATHRDLLARVSEGSFREDLYYRLNVVDLWVPPLRDRVEDIAPLTDRLLRHAADRNAVAHRSLSPDARTGLMTYAFPGNVRELANLLERALILAEGPEITVDDFPIALRGGSGEAPARTLPGAVEALEKSWIRRALAETGGVRARAARKLGLPERVLRYKIRKYDL
ncbi:MAG: sigma-54 dependent transcriptional regulator [Planctomycetota bacterium]